MMQVRVWLAGVLFVAAFGVVSAASYSFVLGDTPEQAAVKMVADAVKSGKADVIKKAVADADKKFADPSELMHMYRPRNKAGMGWGPNAGKNPAADGLEKKIQEFAKGVPPNIANDVANNVEAGRWMTALAELTLAKVPAKNMGGGKTIKAWTDWSNELKETSVAFTKAAEAKNGANMAKAASKMNSLCINCHSKFKE